MDEPLERSRRSITPSKRRPLSIKSSGDVPSELRERPLKLSSDDDNRPVPCPHPTSLEQVLARIEKRMGAIVPRLEDYINGDQCTLDLSHLFLVKSASFNWKLIGEFCTHFNALTTVMMKLNRLAHVSSDSIGEMFRAFRRIPSLLVLNISCNDIGIWQDWSFTKFCYGLARLSTLVEINLANNMLYGMNELHLIELAAALNQLPNLKRVNFCFNDFGGREGRAWRVVISFLKAISAQLDELNLSWNGLGHLDDNDWWVFLSFAGKFKGHLIIDHNSISNSRLLHYQHFMHYMQHKFERDTGGSLKNLIARTLWKNPEKYHFKADTMTVNNTAIPSHLREGVQQQKEFAQTSLSIVPML